MCWYDRDIEFVYFFLWLEKFFVIEWCCIRYKIILLDVWCVDINKNKIIRVD